MARYYPTAIGTFPSLLFLFKELIDAILLDEFEVLDHTHPVEVSVACIYMIESFAGIITAFVAVLYLATQEEIASLFEESALLISRSATKAVRHSNSLALHIMFVSKVSAANPAIHSTRSD